MMLKHLATGALCAILSTAVVNAAPAPHAHHTHLEPHCHCPKGFAFTKGQCVTEATTPKQPICPYQKSPHHGDLCLKPIPAKNDCPKDFSFVPKVGCVKDDEASLNYECPKAFFLNGTVCRRHFNVPKILTCPDGEFLQGSECIKINVAQVTPQCQGEEGHEKCFLVQNGLNTLECPVGFVLIDNKCEKVEFAEKVYVCHWHYRHVFDQTADDHPTKKCPKVVNVPCVHQHRKLAPEDGDELVEAGLEFDHELSHGHSHGPAHGHAHGPAHGHAHGHSHGHGKEHHVKQCTKTEYYPAKGRCPRGFVPVDTAAEKYIHSHQYTKKEKPQCYRVEIVAPEFVCADMILENKCSKVLQIPFNLTCPTGYKRAGTVCIEIARLTPGEGCPPFAEKKNNSNGTFRCEVVRTLPAKPVCPVGFELKGKQCLQLTIVPPRVCLHYAIEKNGKCFLKVDPIYKCPKGFQPSAQDAALCVSTQIQPPVCEHKGHAHPHPHAGYPWVDNSFPHGQY